MKLMHNCIRTFLSIKQLYFFFHFSLYFGEKIFWWVQRENTKVLLFIFFHSPSTKHTPKKFPYLFSLKNIPFTLFHTQTNTPSKQWLVITLYMNCPHLAMLFYICGFNGTLLLTSCRHGCLLFLVPNLLHFLCFSCTHFVFVTDQTKEEACSIKEAPSWS